MSSGVQQRIDDVSRLYREAFSDLAFLEFDSQPLELSMPEGPVRFLRVELPHQQFLHPHSLTLVDAAGKEVSAAAGRITLSSVHGNGGGDLARDRVFDPAGGHDVAFHTTNDPSPWFVVELAEPVVAKRLLVRNRAGRYAHRAAGISVSASPDGVEWKHLYDGVRRAEQFIRAVSEGNGKDASKAEVAAAFAAAKLLACRYGEVAKMLPEKSLAADEIGWIKQCINRAILAPQQLEWTSHGVRRSFRFWGQDEMEAYVALTVAVSRDLAELSPDVCLGFGSVLSIIRDGELMKHDDDLDVVVAFDSAIAPTLHDALALVREFLVAKGYKVQGKFFSHWHVVRGGKKVDVFVGIYEDGRIGWFPGTRRALERTDMFPARTVGFLGSECPIPREPEKYLAITYGADWKSPLPGWKHDWDRSSYADIA
jgi:hypothetical protein